jgi:uncharacterized protein YebE (UPF0316 family)
MLGFVIDIFVTIQQRCVYRHHPVSASILTLAITLIYLVVIEEFISSKSVWLVIGYATGTAIGTYVGMKIPISKDKNTK